MLKKIMLLITAAIFFINTAAFAENEENISMGRYSLDQEEMIAEESKDDAPDPYFKHISGWEEVKPERIYTETLTFTLGSGTATKNLGAKVMPLNAKQDISYRSEDMTIAKVDEKGNVTVFDKPGECDITLTSGNVKKSVTVTVIRAPQSITLSRQDMLFYADRPVSAKLEATITPADVSSKKVIWSSDNTSVASVNEEGLVTPSGVGKANITAKTADGSKEAKCVVYVEIYDVPVRGLFLTNAVDAMPIGAEYSLVPYIYPSNARDKQLTWESSDPNVIEIDSAGVMHALSEGMTNITVRANNGVEDYFTLSSVLVEEGQEFVYNIISEPVENRIASLEIGAGYAGSSMTLDEAIDAQMAASPTIFTTNASPASREDVAKYINPANYSSGSHKYQFLDLSGSNGISERALNTYLSGKGVLEGKGAVFIEAAQRYNVSEIYLAVHACLESGGGTSRLASGTEYNGKTVYNMFGIGAVDSSPIAGGAKYAYTHGWTSVDAAIDGGAKWISENYINNSDYNQNTLYKMRWNPAKPGTHQYATDVAWAVKQAEILKGMFDSFPDAQLNFEVPVYSGENETSLGY